MTSDQPSRQQLTEEANAPVAEETTDGNGAGDKRRPAGNAPRKPVLTLPVLPVKNTVLFPYLIVRCHPYLFQQAEPFEVSENTDTKDGFGVERKMCRASSGWALRRNSSSS